MDLKLLELIHEAQKEEMANRTAEARDNKAFLAMINYAQNKLKSNS